MEKPELSIIVPCYNEEKNIPLILERFSKSIGKKNVELILVDNNSKDGSAKVLKSELKKYKFARTVFQKEPGYGAALTKGFSTAKGEYVAWTHGDIQTPPADVLQAYKIIKNQIDPLKAYVKGKRYGRPLFDVFFTTGMSFFESALFQKRLWDINAQPNLFHRSFLKHLKNPPSDFSFDLYTLILAKQNGYKIIRFPVFFGKRIHGKSSWNTSISGKYKFIKRTLNFSFKLRKEI